MMLPPGLHHGIPAAVYHADPAAAPSLSSSLARRLLETTPRKARLEHPRFHKQEVIAPSRLAERGTAAHALLTGRGELTVIEAEDYKTKAAQEARKSAYAEGRPPVLRDDFARAEAMRGQAIWFLALEGIDPSAMDGEVVGIWSDPYGCTCRMMLDLIRITSAGILVIDYKTTEQEIRPGDAGKYLTNQGYDVQEAFYRRGLSVLFPEHAGRIRFLFLVQDQNEPHDCLLIEPTREMRHIADQKASAAIGIWSRCMVTDDWPGHPSGIVHAYPPGYTETQWAERALTDSAISTLPHDPFITPLPSTGAIYGLTP